MMFENGERVVLSDGVSCREFDDEWVVLDLVGGNYYGLDTVGGEILGLLQAGRSIDEIAAALSSEYDASEHVLTRDILTLVDELKERGLVRVCQS